MNLEELNLEELNLFELNAQEVKEVEGGNVFRVLLEAASIYDAISDFKAGWNSVPAYSRVASGSW